MNLIASYAARGQEVVHAAKQEDPYTALCGCSVLPMYEGHRPLAFDNKSAYACKTCVRMIPKAMKPPPLLYPERTGNNYIWKHPAGHRLCLTIIDPSTVGIPPLQEPPNFWIKYLGPNDHKNTSFAKGRYLYGGTSLADALAIVRRFFPSAKMHRHFNAYLKEETP